MNWDIQLTVLKWNIEGIAWCCLAAYSKRRDKRHVLSKELLSKKEPTHDDLVYSHPIYIVKNAKMRKLTVGDQYYGEKTKHVARQSSEKIKYVTHGSTKSSQAESRNRDGNVQ